MCIRDSLQHDLVDADARLVLVAHFLQLDLHLCRHLGTPDGEHLVDASICWRQFNGQSARSEGGTQCPAQTSIARASAEIYPDVLESARGTQAVRGSDPCDVVLPEFGGVDDRDIPLEYLGLRGICYVELSVATASQDVHSGTGAEGTHDGRSRGSG